MMSTQEMKAMDERKDSLILIVAATIMGAFFALILHAPILAIAITVIGTVQISKVARPESFGLFNSK